MSGLSQKYSQDKSSKNIKHENINLSNFNFDDYQDDELNELRLENSKLKYRLDILKRSIEEKKNFNLQKIKKRSFTNVLDDKNYLSNLIYVLENIFARAILTAFPQLEESFSSVKSSNFADYQCNSSMRISKVLKDKHNIFLKPNEVANKIKENLDQNVFCEKPSLTENTPFININIQKSYLEKKISDLLRNGIKIKPIVDYKKVILDFSSPNIAKEMHVGHLRSTVIGDCLANIFEFLSYNVLRLNHLGDWGTQFGMLLAHLIDVFPDFQSNPPPITDLQEFYKESKHRFDSDKEFTKRSYETVIKLQKKEKQTYEAWKLICDISSKEFSKIYNDLNIKNLINRGESFYQDYMVKLIDELEKLNCLENDDGRKIMWPKNCNKETSFPLILVKSDGGFTYDTSDLACIKHRIEVEKADRIIYVTDDGQAPHFNLIFQVSEDLGYIDKNCVKVEHVSFGVVLGEDKKKFKTRSGQTVKLKELLEEGLARSLKKLKEKKRDLELTQNELEKAQKAIAYGCIKYADLSRDRRHEYEFSFDRMLDDKGNTAIYLLYSLTRIRSIIRKVNLNLDEIVLKHKLSLNHEKEFKLAKKLLKLPEVIHEVSTFLYPHTLCSYLYDVSYVFSEFYENCYCIEKDEKNQAKINIDRILLCEATARVMTLVLNLLGIESLEKM